eukprot:COSAG01_NODE_42734_length_437_cov_0.721893_1_plen_69_part_01
MIDLCQLDPQHAVQKCSSVGYGTLAALREGAKITARAPGTCCAVPAVPWLVFSPCSWGGGPASRRAAGT